MIVVRGAELKNRNCPSQPLMCFILLQTKVSSIYKRKTVNDTVVLTKTFQLNASSSPL